MAENGGDENIDENTVTYGDETVFVADQCDINGEGCEPGGLPPKNANMGVPKEEKAVDVTEGMPRGFIDYSSNQSVFVGDDTIQQ